MFFGIGQYSGQTLVGTLLQSHPGFWQLPLYWLGGITMTYAVVSMALFQRESFGPILPLSPVDSDEEALAKMNDSRLGLTASVWTRDRDRAARLASALECGTVYMNRCDALDPALPWTGAKDSGRGVSLSALGFDALTRPKALHFKLEA